MMRVFSLFLLAILTFFSPSRAQEIVGLDQFNDVLDAVLTANTSDGLVDYQALKTNSKDLDRLASYISRHDLDATSKAQQKAFLINAYNISVIRNVIRYLPVSSPLDKADFFSGKFISFGSKKVSLDTLEKEILYKKHPDFRLHFVLVCAAKGCPPLPRKAMRASSLEKQLELATKNSIRSNFLVNFDATENTLNISELFSWYLEDFGGSEKSLIALLDRYSKNTLPDGVKVNFTKYNWTLNSK